MSQEFRDKSHERAAALVRAGRYEDAIAVYRQLQAADWRDLRALAGLRDLFRKLERRTELADQLCILARHRQEVGRHAQAVHALEQAVEQDRHQPGLHLLLAEALVRAGELEHARLAFFEAAYRANRTGQTEEARRILQCSLEACGDPYVALKRLLGPQPENRTLSAGIELQYLYRCLGWPSDEVYVRVAESMRPTSPQLAEKYQGYAESARKVPHTVH